MKNLLLFASLLGLFFSSCKKPAATGPEFTTSTFKMYSIVTAQITATGASVSYIASPYTATNILQIANDLSYISVDGDIYRKKSGYYQSSNDGNFSLTLQGDSLSVNKYISGSEIQNWVYYLGVKVK